MQVRNSKGVAPSCVTEAATVRQPLQTTLNLNDNGRGGGGGGGIIPVDALLVEEWFYSNALFRSH